jgi:Flp pilus assembly protein TadB
MRRYLVALRATDALMAAAFVTIVIAWVANWGLAAILAALVFVAALAGSIVVLVRNRRAVESRESARGTDQ